MNPKFRYLAVSTLHGLARVNLECPSCRGGWSDIIARKYLVTSLRRCRNCRLLFRAPTTPPATYSRYYQEDYTSGLTTELPDDARLRHFKTTGFSGTDKDFSRYVSILDALGINKGARVLDYGCSWGYGCWQFEQHGFDVLGYDLSKPRVLYGREKLGVDLVSDTTQITGQFDVFFSTHVVEHVPDVAALLNFAFSKLKPDGYFVAVTPNGSARYRARKPGNWARVWGFKHPILFDEVFVKEAFSGRPYLVTTRLDDFSGIADWVSSGGTVVNEMAGWELLVVARSSDTRSQSI